jgi:pyruvate dehydrogenase E2 component (dihydrolipoamide acetyltransferase)
VAEDQPVVEVMTDKATVTITAPKPGIVVETRGKVGQVVPVHAVLVVFDLDGASAAPKAESRTNGHAVDDGPAAVAVSPRAAALHGYYNEKPLATPATRKFARDMHVDLRQVPPRGPQGRVRREDVEEFLREGSAGETPGDVADHPRAPEPSTSAPAAQEERLPFAGLRRRIAQKMSQSKGTAAHFTFVEECDVT